MSKNLNLDNSAPLMTSDRYEDRFYAEYIQLKIRREALVKYIQKYYSGDVDEEPSKESMELILHQVAVMSEYQQILECRAAIENIEL